MIRDDLGHALYQCYVVGYFARPWADLPDHDKERFRIAAEAFAASDEMHRWLEQMRARIAA